MTQTEATDQNQRVADFEMYSQLMMRDRIIGLLLRKLVGTDTTKAVTFPLDSYNKPAPYFVATDVDKQILSVTIDPPEGQSYDDAPFHEDQFEEMRKEEPNDSKETT